MAEAIYLDHHSTTPLAPEVLDAMLPYLAERYGNPRTGHVFGRAARAGLDRAREQVAQALGCDPDEVIFTGGSSEANNLAVKGLAWARRDRGRHLLISAVEHPSIRGACQWLGTEGWTVSTVGVDARGQVSAAAFAEAARDDTVLACLMVAQNEVGTVMPVREAAAAVRGRGAAFLADASQAIGKIPVHLPDLDVDMCVIAAHKFYGPKGVGALYLRRGVELVSLVHGVAHEHGHRAGTENVAGIVGLGAAIELATCHLERNAAHLRRLRDRLWDGLSARIPELVRNGHPTECLPNTLNVCIPGIDSTSLLEQIPEVAASTGAACHWGVTEPSAVLTHMGVPREVALGAIRFSLGVGNTEAEIDRAVEVVASRVAALERA